MMYVHGNIAEHFIKYTLLIIYCAFVGLNNRLYTMHGTYEARF